MEAAQPPGANAADQTSECRTKAKASRLWANRCTAANFNRRTPHGLGRVGMAHRMVDTDGRCVLERAVLMADNFPTLDCPKVTVDRVARTVVIHDGTVRHNDVIAMPRDTAGFLVEYRNCRVIAQPLYG